VEKLLEGLRDVVLHSVVRPDWQDVVAAYCLHLDFAGDEGRNCRRSTAGMDCLWDTSGCVQNSKPPCGNHLENYSRKTRCKHHISTDSIPTCTRPLPPDQAGWLDATKKKSCRESLLGKGTLIKTKTA